MNQEEALSMDIEPEITRQGDPAEIVINGLKNADEIQSLTYKGKPLGVFVYMGKPRAVVGIDLREAPGSYPVELILKDGQTIEKNLTVEARAIAEAPLGIPDKLGGNTPEAEQNLLETLREENAILGSVPTAEEMLWRGKFVYPIKNPIITDTYGYTRLTGASTISHKGTDFRASPGTDVYAMNSGTVRIARTFVEYGNTVVIDHGLGIQTMYMHLSNISVEKGESVRAGQIIGQSGQTGYALAPHLHVSIKIGGISIDPMKFMALFGTI
jgi:murein DD-endopeptidase MepM/ murein hydrolase activator NlpD